MRALFLLALCSFAAPAANTLYNIETYAGTSWSGDGKAATAAVLVQPSGIAMDGAGNVYFADAGDHRIRRVGADGVIATVAGTGMAGRRETQLNSPYGIALDTAGRLYVADLGNALVRRVGPDGTLMTVAGGGRERPAPGKTLKAADALLNQPRDVAVDRSGNVFIADFGAHMVYMVTTDGMLLVLAGTGEAGAPAPISPAAQAKLAYPAALAIDSAGILYVADSGNRRVRRLVQGLLLTLTDKDGKEVEFGTPTGLAFDTMGRLYVADGATRTTVVTPTGELMSVGIGGTSVAIGRGLELYAASERQVLRLNGAAAEVFAGSRSGPGAGDGTNKQEWRFTSPSAIVRDNLGYVYIADTGNGRIRRITPSGELSTLTTRLAAPVSLAFDSKGTLHAGDRASGGVFSVDALGQTRLIAIAESRPMNPAAIAFDSGDNLLIADAANHLIRKTAPDGSMTVLAGGGANTADGPALFAKLASPAGVAVGPKGEVWFAEAGSGRVRLVADGSVTSVASTDLKEPRGVHLTPEGDLVVADRGRHRVFRISPSGEWQPLAGTGDPGFAGDGGPGLAALLNEPSDVAVLPDGGLLALDTGNNRIRLLKPSESQASSPGEVVTGVEVLHAATSRSQAVAPGQIVILKSPSFREDPRITVGGVAASVLDRAQGRLIVQLPAPIPEGRAEVSVSDAAKAAITIVARAPGLFTLGGGAGQAIATNDNGQTNSAASPAARGSIVSFFLTGEGVQVDTVTASIAGYDCEVVWSGAAPGWPGLYQINVRTPAGFAPSGVQPVVITVNGVATQPGVTIVTR
jgi:uncharacterized protein (TIGR03437 family)